MKIYKVGGYVRDRLLGLSPKDCDYVVVGATPDDMLAKGMTQVGADFPVFLDANGDEYALARTERKNGKGYNGFETSFSPDVTLEMDITRRDLTVNAIAMDLDDNVVDPLGHATDLAAKVLRHVNAEAFVEDPVRVLRVARFYARFGNGWTVADETKVLLRQMASSGLLDELTSERVWKEFSRAIMEPHPRLFFDLLLEVGALQVVFPEIANLKKAIENLKWHPEGNSFEHTMLVLEQAKKTKNMEVVLAAIVHDFGKALTKPELMPKHYGHDVNGVPVVEAFCDRLHVPTKTKKRLMHVTRFHMHMHKLGEMKPKTFVRMFESMDAFRDPEVVELLYQVGVADARGRLGSENESVDDLDVIRTIWQKVSAVKFVDVFGDEKPTNPNVIKDKMFRARMNAVNN